MRLSQKTVPDKTKKNLIYYALYAGILVGFVVFILYPDFRKIRQTESDIESLRKKINEQEILYEQYEIYRAEIEKLDKINYFNFTVSIGNEKCIASELQDDIEKICKEHGFSFDRSGSDINHTPDRILLTCSIAGDFRKLRDVLIDFGKMSCMAGIDQIQISPSGDLPDTKISGSGSGKKIVLTLRLFRSQI